MFIEKAVVGAFGVNCYIIADEKTKKGAIIDPGAKEKEILKIADDNNIDIEYIILTHGHADHIGAVLEIKKKTNAKILAHEEEKYILGSSQNNLTALMGMDIMEFEADEYLKDGDIIKIGNLNLEIIHTPGHTPGGMCIKIEDIMFTGDTLFAGSIGRTDLPGGDYDVILKSVKKLATFDEEITVLPGHGPSSKIGIEKNINPFLR